MLATENTGRPPECRLQAGLRGQKVSLANSLGGHRLTQTHIQWHWGQGGGASRARETAREGHG